MNNTIEGLDEHCGISRPGEAYYNRTELERCWTGWIWTIGRGTYVLTFHHNKVTSKTAL